MSRATRHRTALVSFVVLSAMSLILVVIVVLGRYGMREILRERNTLAEAQIVQILESARAWTGNNRLEPDADEWVSLPIGRLIPATSTGSIELRYGEAVGEAQRIECRVVVQWPGGARRRAAFWFVPTMLPAEDDAGSLQRSPN